MCLFVYYNFANCFTYYSDIYFSYRQTISRVI
nr:MAG TPA: hypothetical protein [Caudoviricetes sp.]